MGKASTAKLIKKGAEASLFLANWQGRKAVIKARLPKKYRPLSLDEQIRMYRTIHEPQLLHEAKSAGVPTPMVYLVDLDDASIIMEFVEGKQMKQLLGQVTEDIRKKLCRRIGQMIGKLHVRGIIHGDLTTSNMILSSKDTIFFVDFGLGERSEDVEERAVDLHLMKRALQSSHFRLAKECFDAVIDGYCSVIGRELTAEVLGKVNEIERRGRYVTERRSVD
jgi:TP53 regulating kinase and related kinases